MVAPRNTETSTFQPAVHEPISFTTYSHPIDRDQARYDPDTDTLQPYAHPEVYQSKPKLTVAERREFAIKQMALRVAAGLEGRSLRVIAKSIDCTHTALDNAVKRLCERVGMRKYHVSDTTRQRQRDARRRQLSKA